MNIFVCVRVVCVRVRACAAAAAYSQYVTALLHVRYTVMLHACISVPGMHSITIFEQHMSLAVSRSCRRVVNVL